MNEKDPNPIEELQRQLADIFSNPGLKVGKVTIDTDMGSEDSKNSDSTAQKKSEEFHEEALKKVKSFRFKPKEIKDYLDRYVIRQDEAKKVLSVAICDHYNYVRRCIDHPEVAEQEYNKQNILLLGPTGVGKTYLMRTIAKLIGVPFIKADATKFTETGYAGGDVEDLVRDLVKTANGNIELAQYGIIYLDEIDKIATASGGSHGRDVSGRGVQVNLLKLMEDAEVSLYSPMDMMAQMQAMMDVSRSSNSSGKQMISTRHILFIVSGAFDKLAEEIKRRVGATMIGFGSKLNTADTHDTYQYLQQATTADYIKYGFEPEFVGRVPVRVACESLSVSDLASVLTSSEGSILKQYKENFKGYQIDLKVAESAIHEIAKRAHEEKTGARGLLTVLEKTFREFKFELPSTAIRSLEIDGKTVEDPMASLKKLLSENQHLEIEVMQHDVQQFSDDFYRENSLRLKFDARAVKTLVQEAKAQGKTIRKLCEEKFKDFQHGLKIVARNTGQTEFAIKGSVIADPDKELSKWVVSSFKGKEGDASAESAVPSKPKKRK